MSVKNFSFILTHNALAAFTGSIKNFRMTIWSENVNEFVVIKSL